MQQQHQSSTVATIFAAIGAILVIVSVIALVFANWKDLSPLLRVAVIGAPMLLLYIGAIITRNQENRHEIHVLAMYTANIIFPFWLGTALYQFEIMTTINSGFITVVAAVSTLWYALIEFVLGFRQNAPLTAIGFAIWLFALFSTLELATWLEHLVFGLIALFGLLSLNHSGAPSLSKFQTNVYTGFAIPSIALSMLLWPSLVTINNQELTSYTDLIRQLSFVAASALVLLAIRSVHHASKSQENIGALYTQRATLTIIFCLIALIPPFLIALAADADTTGGFLAVVAGFLISGALLAFANHVRLRTLRVIPTFVLLPLLGLKVLFIVFSAIEITLPLAILLLGLLLFGLAFLLSSSRAKSSEFGAWLKAEPQTSLWQIGEPGPTTDQANSVQFVHHADTEIDPTHLAKARQSYQMGVIIALSVAGFFLLTTILPFLISLISAYRYGEQGPAYYTENSNPYRYDY